MYVRDSLSKKLPVEKCIPGIRAVVGLGMIFSGSAVMGQLSTASGYTSSEVYSTGGDAIVAFSEGSDGALYYMTSAPSYALSLGWSECYESLYTTVEWLLCGGQCGLGE